MMHNYAIKTVGKLTKAEIKAITAKQPVFFIGSHVSVYAPTNLPTGQSFGQALFKYIFQERALPNSFLAKLYQEIPFEALMELCPNKEKALAVLSRLFSENRYNSAHQLIAEKLADKKLSAIITPDYDLTFDNALALRSCCIIKTEPDFASHKDDQPVYFKIHGSADLPETLVYTLKQEGELEKWKYDLLNTLTKEKTIIFAGYSGRDFDICPMIAYEQNYNQIIWLHYGSLETLSPYANYLLNSNPSNLLVTGDLFAFLNRLFDGTIAAGWGDAQFEPESFNQTEQELLIWQLRILDRLAYAIKGLPLLRKNRDRLPKDFYFGMEGSFFAHQGYYRRTAKLCLKIARDPKIPVTDRIQQYISAAGTFSAYGDYLSAWYYSKKAEKLFEANAYLISNILLLRMKLTFLMVKNQYCEKLKLRILQKRFMRKATLIYNDLYERLIHDGAWGERQIVQHMAERLKITNSGRRPLALTADVGYRNLGMPSMDIINNKDLVRSGDPEKVREGLKHIDEAICRAIRIGMYTETWKQSRLKILKQPLTSAQRNKCFKRWWENLNKCEYYWTLKLHHTMDYFYVKYLKRMDIPDKGLT